jgi:uncharacterized protein (DUF2461 family)
MSISTWLTDDQLRELLDRYFAGAYHEDDWPAQLQALVERARQQVFNLESLDVLPDETLVERLLTIYRFVVRVPMYYKAITGHPRRVRAALRYLLESDDDLAVKVDALMTTEGAHYIKGLGKTFWAIFLMTLDPAHNPYWTGKTNDALTALGMANWTRRDSPGQVYCKIAEAEQSLASLHPQADLYGIDHFMHYVVVLEGRDILEQWRGVRPKPPEPGTDVWAKQIARWQAEHLPPERIATRQEAEGEARELLEANLGRFDEEILRRFFELANADFYGGQVRRNRFSPAFVGAYANRIVEQLELFNDWSARLWQVPEPELEDLLNAFWEQKPIAYAGTSLPTLILYLRDPSRYNIWLQITARGLECMTDLVTGHGSGTAYLRYNDAVNQLRLRYDLQPQEMDVILFLAGKGEPQPPLVPKPPAPGVFHGFTPDTFTFLAELRQNNTAQWMEANNERYKRVLREPLRALFKDVAQFIARLDPNLETEAKFGRVMATIKKRWPDEAGPYYPYLWGAFYRAGRTKQTDAQLFVIVHPNRLSVGIGAGKGAGDVLDLFRENVKTHPDLFYRLLAPLLSKGVLLVTYEAHGAEEHQVVPVDSPTDAARLAESDFVDIERHYQLDDKVLYKPEFAAEVSRMFEALYPLYLFFVSEDVESDVAPFLEIEPPEPPEPEYTFEQLQVDTFLPADFLDRLEKLLVDKGQIVLYGPPGTGKTFVAKQFARYFVDQKGGEVRIIQFHPSYAYEEFVEGIRPRSDDGQLTYPVEAGLFRRLCDEARRRSENRYVLIVDEINRGSLPRIFGELLYLLEYRDDTEPVVLPYSKTRFTIPRNVYLIGTMNTADRSIALVDHALRRRFHFVPLKPDPEVLRTWLEAQGRETMAWVADLLEEVNRRLSQDQIDWHLHIGHSHWMVRDGRLDEERAELIWEHSIWPTLEEYFYNRADRLVRYDYEQLKSLVTSVD